MKFISFVAFAGVLTAILYPITGHWVWGGGWLAGAGMWDFAGSSVVHSVGGWAALTGILVLGPRIGKYTKDGRVHPIPGHNMTSIFTGCLAGLVAITAPCVWVSLPAAVLIGGVGGVIVVLAVLAFDSMKIDDPVGALSVHLVNGIWGTLCVGLFASADYSNGAALLANGRPALIMAQLTGIASIGAFTFVMSLMSWLLIKAVMGVRVSAEEEMEGLDLGEHGLSAYPDFAPAAHFGLHGVAPAAGAGMTVPAAAPALQVSRATS